MTSRLAIAVMAQDRPIETDDDGLVGIPDVCGRAWWGFIHGWATTIRDDGCSACGEYAVRFVSALHDLVNIKLIGEGDTDKTVHDPENFVKVARHYHNAVHAAELECTICDPVGILAPVAQELPHAHNGQDPVQRSLFDVLDVEPVPEAGPVDELPIALRPFRFDTRLVRRQTDMEYPEINSPGDVFKLAKDLIDSDRERLLVLYVDTKNRLIGAQEVAVGTKNAALVPVDVVARTAILANATGVFVIHNHPSGDPTPSDEDVASTNNLSEVLALFDIDLVDELVIGAGRFVSMREKGLLKSSAASAAQDGEITYPERIDTPVELIRVVAPMAQESVLSRIVGTTALGVGFSLGGEIARALASKVGGAGKDKTAQLCRSLTPQALKLDISGSGDFVREQLEDPGRFDARSFRTLVQDGHRLIVACPVGSFDPERPKDAQCVDGLELQSVLHPRRCVALLVANAEELGIPIVDDGLADEVEAALQKAGLSNKSRNGANDLADQDGAESTAEQSQQIAVIR